MPSSYDLYATLGLDRFLTSEQIAADLDHRLEGVTRETPQWNELSAARAVLGDPARRSMYDQRLGDPSQTVTPAEIQQLAAMNVGAASTGTSGGLTGVIRQNPKLSATVGVLAVAVLVVGGLAIGGAVGGGDDDDTSNAAAGSNAAPQTEIADDDPHAAEKRQFREYDFLSADQEYSVDADEDGTEDYAISVGNLRTATYVHDPKVDIMEPYEVTAGCVDITARLSDSAMADIRKGVDRDLGEPYDPSAVTWGERQGVSHQFEAASGNPDVATDYDAAMKVIANATWGLDMRWMKHGDNKWTGTVAPIIEDSRIWDKDYSEIVDTPRSLEDPADGEFRGDSTVQTRCFNGQFGWGAEGYPADDSVTGYFIYPYISTVSSDRSEREHTGWKFDK